MSGRKFIKDWEELIKVDSQTHFLEIDLEYGCGWIRPKVEKDSQSYDGHHYLSTHTFYGNNHKGSSKILQSCGFDVELANWDEVSE